MVVELGNRLRLSDETEIHLVGRRSALQHLDHHDPVQGCVHSLVDATLPTLAELLQTAYSALKRMSGKESLDRPYPALDAWTSPCRQVAIRD